MTHSERPKAMRFTKILLLCLVLMPVQAWADIGWFIAPYVRVTPSGQRPPVRGCAVRSFQPQITADGGTWRAVEALGNICIVKVRASAATLQAIAAQHTRIPANRLDAPLSSLTTPQRNALRQIILGAGYTTAEVNARFPNLASNTLGDALRFLASRRLKPRYDQATDSIILDGPVQPTASIDDEDGAVQ